MAAVRVGREAQIEALWAMVTDQTTAGLLITGEAGAGKTFLAIEFLELLEHHDHPTERLSAAGDPEVPLAALSRVLVSDDAYAGVAPTVVLKQAMAVHDRPTVFLIDDANMLDAPSVSTLVEVARSGHAKLVITLRDGSLVPDSIERALVDGTIMRIECPLLDRDECAQLAEAVAGLVLAPATVDTIFELTAGNPLYIRELVTANCESNSILRSDSGGILAELPSSSKRLTDLLGYRLRQLDPTAREAVHRIALVGDVDHAELLEFVDGAALDRLEAHGLVVSVLDGRRLRLRTTHPLFDEIIRSTESPSRARRILVEHAEHCLSYGARRGADRLRLAIWSLDGVCSVGTDVLSDGARLATAARDLVLARRLAQAAFEQEPTVDTALHLGSRLYAVGDFAALKDHLLVWERLVETSSERADFDEVHATAWYWHGYDDTVIEDLLDRSAVADDDSQLQLRAVAGAFLVTAGRIDEAVDLAANVSDAPPGPSAVLVAMTLSQGWRAQGRPIAAERVVAEALDFYRSISTDAHLLSAVAMAGLHIQTLSDAGRFAELDEMVAARSQGWSDSGDAWNLALANTALGYSWLLRGDYDRTLELADLADVGFTVNPHPGMRRWVMTLRALACAESGRLDDADVALQRLDEQRDHPARIFAPALTRARAWVAHHRGARADARRLLRAEVERTLELGNVVAALECVVDLARQGHAADAADLLTKFDLDGLEGDLHAVRLRFVDAAVGKHLGELGRCMAEFDRMGLAHLAAECARVAASQAETRHEAKRWMGEAARRQSSAMTELDRLLGHDSMTSREREVVVLAVQGLTSRQIAEQLGISRRTVDSHLSSVYSKFGIDGRVGLVDLGA